MSPRPSRPRDPDERYIVDLCGFCRHPGGMHVIDQWEPRVTHCRCGKCPGWDEAHVLRRGYWSDRMTAQLESDAGSSEEGTTR